MEWKVKIEGKENQRIKVEFNPKEESLFFYGEYKPNPHNLEWKIWSEDKCPMKTNVETIQNTLLRTYETMKKRIDAYVEIAEGFTLIKVIEIKED